MSDIVEKAIEFIGVTKNDRQCKNCSWKDKCQNDICSQVDKLTISALQEKAEREKGCEYCDFSSGDVGALFDGEDEFFLVTGDNEYFIATDGKGIFRETKIKFCPMCGRRLEDNNVTA